MADANKTTLVELVARLINDVALSAWSFDEVEDALDRNRDELRYERLDPVKTMASGGTITYKTFDAPGKWSHFDEAAATYDYNYDALTPAAEDLIAGRWTYSTEPTRPVYVLGYSYDIYGAAADLLEERAAQLAEDVQTFSAANGSFGYANKRSGPLELAAKYRARSRRGVTSARMVRSDTNS